MRIPLSWKALAAVAGLALSGCQCGPSEPALTVTVTIDADVAATCALLEVSSGGTVRLTQELRRPAGKNSWKVGMAKQQLPTDIRLVARSFTSASGSGCSEPRIQTSASDPVDAKFPASGGVGTATVAIHQPPMDLDGDRDGHIALGRGGDDCNDALASVHPGLPAVCASAVDNDCDGKGGCADSECASAAVCNMPPTQLVFVTSAAPVNVGACSPALTVEAQGASGQAVLVAADTSVALTALPPNGVTLYADSGCTAAVTGVTIPSGMSRATFHFKATQAGMFQATASILGLPTATQVQTVVQQVLSQLVFTTPARTVGVGGCTAALTLQTRDAAGMPAPVAMATSVSIASSQAGVAFFSDAACTAALTNSALPFAAGATDGTFYAKATAALATTLTATLTGVPPATQLLTVQAGVPTQLQFATAPQGVQSGACSNVVTVETRDMGNNPASMAMATAVTLTPSGVAITLYSDATCTTAITAPVPLAANASAVSFYFRGTAAGMATIAASVPGLTPAMQTEVVGVGAPDRLTFTSLPQTVVAGQCSGATTVQAQDMNGNPSNVTGAALAVTLGGPATMFGLFSDASCLTAISAPVNIAVGNNTATFYFRGTKSGPAVVTAAATMLTGGMQTETVTAAAPMALVFTSAVQTQPAGACAQFDLEARDAFGNPSAPGSAVMVGLASTPPIAFGPMGCGSTVTSVGLSGATVSFFATSTVAGTKDVTATAPFGAATQTFTVGAGMATKLAFVAQPSTVASGAAIVPPVQVAVQDTFGNTVTTSTASVAVALNANPGSSVLSGTTTVAAVAGVASFPTLSLDKVGTGYTLNATSAPLTAATSIAFDVTPGQAATLAFTVQPSNATAGVAIAPSVRVTLRDAAGNTTTSTANVTLAFGANPGSGALSGTTTVAAVAGVATFPGLSVNRAAAGYTLSATSGALPAATSAAFDIAAGSPAQLAFGVQPGNAQAGAAMAPAVTVRIEDALGNLTAATDTVNVALGANPGSSTLGGSVAAPAVAGVATFSTLTLNKTGMGYTLVASSGTTLTSATSSAFDISAGTATQLVFVTEPTNAVAGAGIVPPPTVSIEDANNNRVLTSTANVTLAIGANPGASTLSGTATVPAVAGLATFAGLSLNKTGTGYTLVASSGILTTDTSAPFNIGPGTPASLSFTVQPTNIVSTNGINPAPQVTVLDANANVVTTSTLGITVSIGTNPGSGVLSGTATVAAAAGVATFPGLSIDKIGTGYTLSASATGPTPAVSAPFNVTLGPASKLAILGAPLTVPALDCSAARVVQIQDNGGNPVNSTGPTVLDPYTAAPGSANTLFFSNPTCTTAQAVGTRTIANGTNSVTFYFSANTATPTVTLTASVFGATTLTDATQTATIAAATPTDLEFTSPPPVAEAGFCQALTLERQDALGRPTAPAFATTVSLASTPSTGILFFSNPTCTVPLAANFDILAGAATTQIYAKGISGGLASTVVPTAQDYDLTASSTVPATLNAGTLTVNVLPMVRRRGTGTCTFSGLTGTCNITPTLSDISRTFLIFQATQNGTADSPSNDNVSCFLDPNMGTARVSCERIGTSGAIDVEWQTVSFPYAYAQGGVTVDHVNGSCQQAATLGVMPIDVPVSDHPTAERFVLFSTTSFGFDNDYDDFFTAQLLDSDTLRISQSNSASTACNTTMGFRAQVVTWAGAVVNRGVLAGGVGPFTVSQATAPSAPAVLLYSSRQVAADVSVANICRRRLRGDILNPTTLQFDRGCAGGDVQDISWEHVVLPTGTSVQRVQGTMANAVGAHAPGITTAVDLTRSFAFIGGQGPGGSASGFTDYATTDRVSSAQARTRLTANNVLTFTRSRSEGAADWIGWVVQLTP